MNDLLKSSLQRYVEHHRPAGHFLTAVLVNNLLEAARFADSENRKNLAEIVLWCDEHLPPECWGSFARVERWLSKPNNREATC